MIQFSALVEAINQSIQNAARSVEENGADRINDFFDTKKDNNGNVISCTPKTFPMEFPTRTAKGIDVVKVNVPLITLSAIASPRISEVKFSTELEITDENGELLVAFKPQRKAEVDQPFTQSHSGMTKIEIILKNGETPEGLKKVIEGYERALRAQIPG